MKICFLFNSSNSGSVCFEDIDNVFFRINWSLKLFKHFGLLFYPIKEGIFCPGGKNLKIEALSAYSHRMIKILNGL